MNNLTGIYIAGIIALSTTAILMVLIGGFNKVSDAIQNSESRWKEAYYSLAEETNRISNECGIEFLEIK